MIDSEPTILNSTFDFACLNTHFSKWDIQKNVYRAREEMFNVPALKNNLNVNRKTFDRSFERLENAVRTFYNE